MTIRDELEHALEAVQSADMRVTSDEDYELANDLAFDFLRDHGPALVEALRDTERYRQLLKILDPDMVPGGVTLYYALDKDVDQLVYSDDELNEILDAARGES